MSGERLRVAFTVEYNVLGDIPELDADGEFGEFFASTMLGEAGARPVDIVYEDDGVDFCLEPVGWGVDLGYYGDMRTGLVGDRTTTPADWSAVPSDPIGQLIERIRQETYEHPVPHSHTEWAARLRALFSRWSMPDDIYLELSCDDQYKLADMPDVYTLNLEPSAGEMARP